MVGHKLVEVLHPDGATSPGWEVVVFAEEPRPAYDRVHLSALFDGVDEAGLSMVADGFFDDPSCTLHLADPVVAVDRERRTVTTRAGVTQRYDALVFATGSSPFVPPIPGRDATGCFVYRTIDDLHDIADFSAGCRRGAVIGGGLLGLEAANALRSLGVETHVVELAPRLMPVQVDDVGSDVLRERIDELGVHVHLGVQTTAVLAGEQGQVVGLELADGERLDVDMVVFSAGIRPRDELARAAGLEIGERGGVVVDDTCRTTDEHIWAIGECAHVAGRTWGLVAPGYQMARVVADRLDGGDARFAAADLSTKLKLLGVEVASFGDAFGVTEGSRSVVHHDPVGRVYRRLVVDAQDRTRPRLLGGILVGDANGYDALTAMVRGDQPCPAEVAALAAPAGAPSIASGPGTLSDSAIVCSCNHVTKGAICDAIASGAHDTGAIRDATSAGSGCGGCVALTKELLADELTKAGIEVSDDLCEHFAYRRQDLFAIMRVERITSFAELLARHGAGLGCEICKPAVASMLASTANGYVLDGEQAALQDTNDHFLANLQKDGSYSVVPRVPGGEITPDQLIAIGAVARDFGLYTKITGGQRIDLFGARVEQLPAIWQRLLDAGMESGHAYAKALRTVKSCVGRTWCRYGVQDSTALAIRLELRYRGLRAPHKLKLAVSGCVRECAEAQGKDVGVIATETGWNLYVAGNGGARPQHASLLATDLDEETLVRTIDRFLGYYILTADRLERTATWFNRLDGGLEHLQRVVMDDALGLAEEFEAVIARHVDTYECEWSATLRSPERLELFRTFVNSDEPDPGIVFVSERGQPRPATPEERVELDRLEVRR
jgi:nitrite reductase (NADH) large subunit